MQNFIHNATGMDYPVVRNPWKIYTIHDDSGEQWCHNLIRRYYPGNGYTIYVRELRYPHKKLVNRLNKELLILSNDH